MTADKESGGQSVDIRAAATLGRTPHPNPLPIGCGEGDDGALGQTRPTGLHELPERTFNWLVIGAVASFSFAIGLLIGASLAAGHF